MSSSNDEHGGVPKAEGDRPSGTARPTAPAANETCALDAPLAGPSQTLDLDLDPDDAPPRTSYGTLLEEAEPEPWVPPERGTAHPGRYTLLDWEAYEHTGRSVPTDNPRRATIGAGGMGRVLLAFDEQLERLLALKENIPASGTASLGSGQAGTPSARSRFLQEARVTGALQHPNIVPVHELGLGADGQHHYYTMRLVRGRSMGEALEQAQGLRDRLALLPHMADLCHAIAFAHSQGVVHRDIKPDNVMIGEFGETVVLDWGIAKVLGQDSAVSLDGSLSVPDHPNGGTVGGLLGTPAYIAPERVVPRPGPVDAQADIWSLGVVLYQLLTGCHPIPGSDTGEILAWLQDPSERVTPVRKRCPDAPPELASIAMGCLERDKRRRTQDARELARDIERYQAGERVVAHRYTTWEILRHAVTRSPTLSATVAVGGLAAAVAGGLLWSNHLTRLEAERLRHQGAFETLLLAQDALAEGRPLEAKARLRSAIEVDDMLLARTLWQRLQAEPLMWSRALHTEVTGLAFSPDGARLAVAKAAPELLLMDTLTRAEQPLAGTGENLYVVAWSSTGARLAAGAGSGDLLLWDLPEPRPRVLHAHSDLVSCVAIDSAGARLLSGSFDGTAQLHDLASGARIALYQGHEGPITSIGWAPDQQRFATTGADGTVRVWEVEGSAPVATLTGHSDETTGVAFSADGQRLFSTGFDSTVRAWSTTTWEPVLMAQQPVGFSTLTVSGSQGAVIAGSLDGSIHLLDAAGLHPPRQLRGHKSHVVNMAVSPSGDWLASGSDDRTVRLWDLSAAADEPLPTGHAGAVASVAWDPDGARLISAGWDGSARIWDRATGRQISTLTGHDGKVHCAAIGPDGTLAATGGTDRTVRLWSLDSGEVQRFLSGHEDEVVSLSFHPALPRLASGGEDGSVWIWDLGSGAGQRVLEGWGSTRVAWTPDGRGLAMSRSDWQGSELLLLDPEGGATLQATVADGVAIEGIAFGARADQLLAVSRGGDVLAWSVASGDLHPLLHLDGGGNAVAPSPTGVHLAASTTTTTAILPDPSVPDTTTTVGARLGPIASLAFDPSGATLATAGYDGTVRTWAYPTAQPFWRGTALLAPLGLQLTHRGWQPLDAAWPTPASTARWAERAAGWAQRATVSGDGRWLCLVDAQGAVELWDTERDQLQQAAAGQVGSRALATPGGCAILRPDGSVDLMATTTLQPGVLQGISALSSASDGFLAAGPELLVHAGHEGATLARWSLGQGRPSALCALGDGFAVGGESGRVQLLSSERGEQVPRGYLQGGAPSPVRVLTPGPGATVAVGFEDGTVGLWDPTTRRQLLERRLHGPVNAIAVREGQLFALTELGDATSLDLAVLEEAHCALMQQIWAQLPVCWDGSEASFCAAPADHACSEPAAGR